MGSVAVFFDNLCCPICTLIPDGNVYQCKNGHVICSNCIDDVVNCPQCNLPYGREKIRCGVLESLLERAQLKCPFANEGCTKSFRRKELQQHKKVCTYRPINLCEQVGLNCDFVVCNGSNLAQHLEHCHGVKKFDEILQLCFDNFLQAFYNPRQHRQWIYVQQVAGCNEESSKFVVFVELKFREESAFCSSVCLYLGDCSENTGSYIVEFKLETNEKQLVCKWSGFPTHFKEAQSDIEVAPFRTSVEHIRKRALTSLSVDKDFKLNLFVTITKI